TRSLWRNSGRDAAILCSEFHEHCLDHPANSSDCDCIATWRRAALSRIRHSPASSHQSDGKRDGGVSASETAAQSAVCKPDESEADCRLQWYDLSDHRRGPAAVQDGCDGDRYVCRSIRHHFLHHWFAPGGLLLRSRKQPGTDFLSDVEPVAGEGRP